MAGHFLCDILPRNNCPCGLRITHSPSQPARRRNDVGESIHEWYLNVQRIPFLPVLIWRRLEHECAQCESRYRGGSLLHISATPFLSYPYCGAWVPRKIPFVNCCRIPCWRSCQSFFYSWRRRLFCPAPHQGKPVGGAKAGQWVRSAVDAVWRTSCPRRNIRPWFCLNISGQIIVQLLRCQLVFDGIPLLSL